MQITKIEVQKKKKDRYNIYVDDQFRFGLDEGVVARFGLYEKKEIDQSLIDEIEKDEVFAKAFNSAITYLRARERSQKEIRDKLKTKEYSENIIEKVLVRLAELDLVNDKRFAKMFVSDRMKLKPKGKRVLQIELMQKGIDKNIIEEVLYELVGGDSEIELAKKVLEKALKKYGNMGDGEVKQRVIKYLQARGFSWSIIESVLDNI